MSKNSLRTLSVSAIAIVISAALAIVMAKTYDFAIAGSLQPSAAVSATMHSLLEIASKDSNNTFDRSTDSLEAISEKLDTIAPASTALSNAVWTDARAASLDYINTDLKYLVSEAIGTPVSGSVADKISNFLTNMESLDQKTGQVADYSGYYAAGTDVFKALKDIRDKLSGY